MHEMSLAEGVLQLVEETASAKKPGGSSGWRWRSPVCHPLSRCRLACAVRPDVRRFGRPLERNRPAIRGRHDAAGKGAAGEQLPRICCGELSDAAQ